MQKIGLSKVLKIGPRASNTTKVLRLKRGLSPSEQSGMIRTNSKPTRSDLRRPCDFSVSTLAELESAPTIAPKNLRDAPVFLAKGQMITGCLVVTVDSGTQPVRVQSERSYQTRGFDIPKPHHYQNNLMLWRTSARTRRLSCLAE